ncbi:NAD(P)/FAD-dependent oxidoreductase [Sinomicrobium weinanense]|uniref:FAD-dependent oxidoreductase n=1 Tax=Sinomicrobium weinanense TaxID=2842200 RepID=A0A926JPB2_9FLAO|nr:FAD-dependent oxidoreductase [Sinomicrobium weinanense]MBC9794834.1 FAD-dependent oxidoreductase [Sinomicrobium weinanense]MBU3125605.1 FAD-binding oxidoreductase [Sinomicrobium weinanense]
MVTDYIVVGLGLAGIAFCEQLRENQKDFVVFDGDSQQSSSVAGGVYNPVVLKRFTAAWRSEEQLKIAVPFYRKLETALSCDLVHTMPVYRKFASIEEQNLWFEAADKPALSSFLSPRIIQNTNPAVDAPHGFGEVWHTGRIAVRELREKYTGTLLAQHRLRKEHLYYEALTFTEDGVQYQDIKARHIVFAEGFGMMSNPFFNTLPLRGAKGELLTIKAPELKLQAIIKSSVFLIPLGGDHYKVGATYNWKDKTNETTSHGREELLAKLRPLIRCDYEVTDQEAGIRPTVADRRPLVGKHPLYDHMYILNGLGTRGTLTGPYVAGQLYGFIEEGVPLAKEIDIYRFRSRFKEN